MAVRQKLDAMPEGRAKKIATIKLQEIERHVLHRKREAARLAEVRRAEEEEYRTRDRLSKERLRVKAMEEGAEKAAALRQLEEDEAGSGFVWNGKTKRLMPIESRQPWLGRQSEHSLGRSGGNLSSIERRPILLSQLE